MPDRATPGEVQPRPLTVRGLLMALIDLPEGGDLGATRDAVVQVTADGEHFYVIDRVEDQGLDGIWLSIVPYAPDFGAIEAQS